MSNASEDLPDPDGPVTTVSALRGISMLTFLRLLTRAPLIEICLRELGAVADGLVDFVRGTG